MVGRYTTLVISLIVLSAKALNNRHTPLKKEHITQLESFNGLIIFSGHQLETVGFMVSQTLAGLNDTQNALLTARLGLPRSRPEVFLCEDQAISGRYVRILLASGDENQVMFCFNEIEIYGTPDSTRALTTTTTATTATTSIITTYQTTPAAVATTVPTSTTARPQPTTASTSTVTSATTKSSTSASTTQRTSPASIRPITTESKYGM